MANEGRSSRRRFVVALVVVTAALGATDARGDDPTVLRVGWWTRSPSAEAPADGVVVGSAPDGPESVAAIEVEGAAAVTLTLTETGGTLRDVASIQVCTTADSWSVADGGDLAGAPTPDCAGAVTMDRADGSWRADVTPLLPPAGDVVTLMLVPGVQATPISGIALPFEVRLDRPELAATTVSSTSTTPDAAPAPPPASSSPTSQLVVPPAPTVTAPTATTTASTPATVTPRPAVPGLGAEETRRTWRWGLWLRIVVLAALAGGAAGIGRWKVVSRWEPTSS